MDSKEIISTRQAIMDAAEELFAERGFFGTSVRAITTKAGVNLAGVNYHFGSKEALIEEVFRRRFGHINETRMERMAAVLEGAKKARKKPALKDVLHAFISPLFEEEDGPPCMGRMSALIQMAHTGQNQAVLKILFRTFSPVVDSLFSALRQAMPRADENHLRWKMHFLIGGFSHTIRISQLQVQGIQSKALPAPLGQKEAVRLMVNFFAAGMEAK